MDNELITIHFLKTERRYFSYVKNSKRLQEDQVDSILEYENVVAKVPTKKNEYPRVKKFVIQKMIVKREI